MGPSDSNHEGQTKPQEPAGLDKPSEVWEADDDANQFGRIGYGRWARFSPLMIAILLVGTLVIAERDRLGMGGASKGPASMIGKTAPDLSLTLFDSSRLHLKDLRGSVVVLNFWASWCKPCREEMPVLQRVYDEYANSATSVVIVGVGTRTDNDPDARELVQTLGLTYPIGRDTNTDQPGLGPIEIAFGDPSAYPSTYFIRPDGVIDRIVVGPLSEEQLRGAIAEVAATDT